MRILGRFKVCYKDFFNFFTNKNMSSFRYFVIAFIEQTQKGENRNLECIRQRIKTLADQSLIEKTNHKLRTRLLLK